MLLRIPGEKGAKNCPWITLENPSIAVRPSVRDHVGVERVAAQI